MIPLDYIRRYPFSIMALCNIIGDSCYLGFAFAAIGFVSIPKLAGALFTVAAHIVLLAYADDQNSPQNDENDFSGHIIVKLKKLSRCIMAILPEKLRRAISAKPVGISFIMYSFNGVGLLIDAFSSNVSTATISQIALGCCVTVGCGAFSLADYVKNQRLANILLKIAPTILMAATLSNIILASTTRNGFMITACTVFLIASFAGYYTKLDKSVAGAA